MFDKVCTYVSMEPLLLTITGEDQARNVNTADEAVSSNKLAKDETSFHDNKVGSIVCASE